MSAEDPATGERCLERTKERLRGPSVSRRSSDRGITPGLGTILVGDDPNERRVRARQARGVP